MANALNEAQQDYRSHSHAGLQAQQKLDLLTFGRPFKLEGSRIIMSLYARYSVRL